MPKRYSGSAKGETQKIEEERPIYMAAVRYRDGSSELIRVKDADSLADARAMIKNQIMNVHSMVIALHK
jgi:hypothetical protein